MSVRVQRVITQKTGRLFSQNILYHDDVYRQAKEFDQANEFMEKSSQRY